jgi:hypothetical protein
MQYNEEYMEPFEIIAAKFWACLKLYVAIIGIFVSCGKFH